MRIIIATGIYPPDIGGPAYYAHALKAAFERQGHVVRVVTYGWTKRLPTGIRHVVYLIKLIVPLLFSRPSAVIALDTFSVGFPAILGGRFFRVPVIVRSGGDFLWEFYIERTGEKILLSEFYAKPRRFTMKEQIIFSFTKWTFQHADTVVFSTQYQQNIFTSAYSLSPSRTAIIENYYGSRQTAEEPQKKNFICFTRQLKWKNLDTLQEAFKVARIRHPEIVLETGSLPRERYLERLRRCYAVILVSLGDISPNMILEAIQYGKPFILTTENGLEEKIQRIGLRANPRDVESISRAIEMLANPVFYEKEQEKIKYFSFLHSYDEIAREFTMLMNRP